MRMDRASGRDWLRTAMTTVLVAVLSACVDPPPDPANELPIGVVDTPAAGEVLRPGPTMVGGWAADDTGILEVRIYFDGRFVTRATPTVARPDVAKALPKYARTGDLYGWNVAVDFAATPGAHTILAQAVDRSGATRDIGVIPVTVPR
jgi:hypothetical protein